MAKAPWVQDFKERAKSWGIYREYSGVDELVEHARRDLLATVRDHLKLPEVGDPGRRNQSMAQPVAAVERDFDRRPSLVIQNQGTGNANNLRFAWLPIEDDEYDRDPPETYGLNRPVRCLVAGARIEFPLMIHSGAADMADLAIRWGDDEGNEVESVQTVAM